MMCESLLRNVLAGEDYCGNAQTENEERRKTGLVLAASNGC
jgi:hypothetical protein